MYVWVFLVNRMTVTISPTSMTRMIMIAMTTTMILGAPSSIDVDETR